MGGLCCKTHLPAPKADNNCIGELLAELQATSSSCLQGPVPEKLLELIDCVLNALQSSVASVGRVESTLGGALDAVRPHVEAFAAFATAVKQVLDVKESRFLPADAWSKLGMSAATAVLTASSTASYIGPVFAVFSYAIMQWSTCQQVPQEALEMLRACRDLLFDINSSWEHLVSRCYDGDVQQKKVDRVQGWIKLLASAAAECVVMRQQNMLVRFSIAHIHKADLASKATAFRDLRQQLMTLLIQAVADKADSTNAVLAQLTLTVQKLAPAHWPIPKLIGKEGRDELVAELRAHLLPGPGTSGLLLHGMGGVGKTTVAALLANHLQKAGVFPGGVHMVSIQLEVQYQADDATLVKAQQELLQSITKEGTKRSIPSLDIGAQLVYDELSGIQHEGPVLLVIDNVPEEGGILGMFAGQLDDCLAEGSRVLFTSRNSAPQGLCLHNIKKFSVGCLAEAAATKVLLAGGLQLDGNQLAAALKFCGGLPLALTLLHGALAAVYSVEDPGSFLVQLIAKGSLGYSQESQLWSRLKFSLNSLSEDLRGIWLDLAIYFLPLKDVLLWHDVSVVVTPDEMKQLERRNLVTLHRTGKGPQDFEFRIHDVLYQMAVDMCGPGSKDYRATVDNSTGRLPVLSSQGTCAGIWANTITYTVKDLPPIQYLRSLVLGRHINLSIGAIDDLAHVLQHGTNLRDLEVEIAAPPAVPWMTQAHKLRRLKLKVQAGGPETADFELDLSFLVSCTSLRGLELDCAAMTEIPQSISMLQGLQRVCLTGCKSWTHIAAGICELKELECLDLRKCSNLQELPATLGNLTRLTMLDLSRCESLQQLPTSLGQLQELQCLHLDYCTSLLGLPNSIGDLQQLRYMKLMYCSNLASLPESFAGLTSLRLLELAACQGLARLPSMLGQLNQLQYLSLAGCSSLTELPESVSGLSQLQQLALSFCARLKRLPEGIGKLQQLQRLYMFDCSSLEEFPESFEELPAHVWAQVASCQNTPAVASILSKHACNQPQYCVGTGAGT